VEGLRRAVRSILARLKRNEGLDTGQGKTFRDHERRIAVLERKIGKRVNTLDADE
jgi:RimJ/RimL family protein N-acetyltransferase